MRNLWTLTKKNVKMLVRAKGSALIIIFAPLVLMLILGLSYNTDSQYGLNIGVYSTSFTDDVNQFISILEEEEFTIIRYEVSLDECLNDIKSGKTHTCINLPENLQIEENKQKEITFHVDQSRINLVWMIQDTVQGKFNLRSQELSQSLTQNILSRLSETKDTLSKQKSLLSAAKEKTSGASSSAATIKSGLTKLDLVTADGNYTGSGLTTADKDLKEAKSLVLDAQSGVNSAGIEDDTKRSEIKSYLTDAEEKIDAVIESLDGNSTTGVGGIVAALSEELEKTNDKLKAAAHAIANSNKNLDSVSGALKESSDALDNVQKSLDSLESSIGGVKVTDADTITSPLVTKIESVSGEGTYLNYLFSALLVLVIMFSSLLLGTTIVMMEKTSPAFLRNFFLPIRKITFVTSIYLTNLLLNIIQIVIILGISLFFLKGTYGTLPPVALILLISASVFTFMGMVVGYLFNSEETAVLASISLGSLHLLFSGLILPLESVNIVLREIAFYNPFVIADKLVRNIFLFGASLQDVWFELGLLIGYMIIFFLIILVIESILHQHLVNRFMRHHHRAHRQKDKKSKKDA